MNLREITDALGTGAQRNLCDALLDPPKAFGAFFSNSTGYPGNIYDATGRFVYISLTKKS